MAGVLDFDVAEDHSYSPSSFQQYLLTGFDTHVRIKSLVFDKIDGVGAPTYFCEFVDGRGDTHASESELTPAPATVGAAQTCAPVAAESAMTWSRPAT